MSVRVPTLCLNMIVKNESKVIRRLLLSVAPVLDSYCICDTGSTDDTIDIIQSFFKERGIPGMIVHEPFRDFGYNRSYALKACHAMPGGTADYLLLMDADMMLRRNSPEKDQEIKQRLSRFKAFHLFQGSDTYKYKNVRIVKNYQGFSYWGVTHEYLKSPEGMDIIYETIPSDEWFIDDIGDGGSKSDKFERDIRLLTQGLVELPNNDRYTFYLANSYRDHGDKEKAIETYKKRIEIGGWKEEVWQSYWNIGVCYRDMGNMPMAIYYWLEAFQAHPDRIENLYEIVKHYRVEGKHALSYYFYSLANHARNAQTSRDFLFTQMDVYDYKLDYELSIIGYYHNPENYNLARVSMNVIRFITLEENIYRNVLSNYKFYAPDLAKYQVPLCAKNREFLETIGRDLFAPYLGDFVSSTPSLCFDSRLGDLVICVRYVNYRIDDQGNYVNHAVIESKNVIARFSGVTGDTNQPWKIARKEMELDVDKTYDGGRYRGLEDVRLFSYDKDRGVGAGRGRIIYNANRGLDGVSPMPSSYPEASVVVEHGWIVYDAAEDKTQTVNDKLLQYSEGRQDLEKNWCLFAHDTEGQVKLKCVYKWSPLVIGTICPEMGRFTETHRFEAASLPHFFKDVRCSTNGVAVGNHEIWFIGHLVSYEERRYYYHIMLVLDATTLRLKKYTPLWTFERAKVEYTLGMVFFPDYQRFLIGYSLMDKETKYMMISKHIFDDKMIFI